MRLQPKLQIKKLKTTLKPSSRKVVKSLPTLTNKLEKLISYMLNYALIRQNNITLHLRIATQSTMTSIWRRWNLTLKDWITKYTKSSLINPFKLGLRTLRRKLQKRTYRTRDSHSKTLTKNSRKLNKAMRILESTIATLRTII